jgi:hypothetical protein
MRRCSFPGIRRTRYLLSSQTIVKSSISHFFVDSFILFHPSSATPTMSNYTGPLNNHGDAYYGQQGQGYYPPHQEPGRLPQQQYYNPTVSMNSRPMVALPPVLAIVNIHLSSHSSITSHHMVNRPRLTKDILLPRLPMANNTRKPPNL